MNINDLHDGKTGSAISVRITPRSKKNEIVSVMEDGVIKIKLTAPPVDGKANEALLKFLAVTLKISKNNLEIVGGLSGRNKLIAIFDLLPSEVEERISEAVSKK